MDIFVKMVGIRRNKTEPSSKFDICILLDPKLILFEQFKLNYGLIVGVIPYNYAKANPMLYAQADTPFGKRLEALWN